MIEAAELPFPWRLEHACAGLNLAPASLRDRLGYADLGGATDAELRAFAESIAEPPR